MAMGITISEAVALGVQWRGNATQHSSHEDLPQLATHRSELLSREEAVIRCGYIRGNDIAIYIGGGQELQARSSYIKM